MDCEITKLVPRAFCHIETENLTKVPGEEVARVLLLLATHCNLGFVFTRASKSHYRTRALVDKCLRFDWLAEILKFMGKGRTVVIGYQKQQDPIVVHASHRKSP